MHFAFQITFYGHCAVFPKLDGTYSARFLTHDAFRAKGRIGTILLVVKGGDTFLTAEILYCVGRIHRSSNDILCVGNAPIQINKGVYDHQSMNYSISANILVICKLSSDFPFPLIYLQLRKQKEMNVFFCMK